jgi:hypothetical protein
LLLAVAGCSSGSDADDDLPPAHIGQVISDVFSSDVEGRHTYVVLPGRRYDFTVSRPHQEIGSLVAEDVGVSPEAPDDRRFVEIAWELNVPPGDTFVMEAPEDVSPMLALIADGERYRLGAMDQEGVRAAIVVVPEEADDIGLEIEYDGLTQVVEDVYDAVITRADGPDSLYLEAPSVRWENCPETRLEKGDPAVSVHGASCQANISSPVPYFGPLGWAPPGRAWVVVRFLAGALQVGYDAPSDYVEYTEYPDEVRLRIEGASGAPELFPLGDNVHAGSQDDGSWEAQAVFSVDDTLQDPRLSFRRVVTALAEDHVAAAAAGAPDELRRVHAGEL